MSTNPERILQQLARTIEARKRTGGADSYVAQLLARGEDAILKKIGEESAEVLLAAKGGKPDELVHELADLWFHCLVLLAQRGLGPDEVLAELARREGRSGLAEKAARQDGGKKSG